MDRLYQVKDYEKQHTSLAVACRPVSKRVIVLSITDHEMMEIAFIVVKLLEKPWNLYLGAWRGPYTVVREFI